MSPQTENLIKAAIVADVMREAEAAYWLRRAQAFESAKPTAAEMLGATPERLVQARQSWRRCHETAEACRARAQVALTADVGDVYDEWPELGEVA